MLTREYESLQELRVWHRFHVRLTAAFGVASFIALAAMGWSYYQSSLGAELDGMRTHLLGMAVSLAATLDADLLAEMDAPEDADRPEYARLFAQLDSLMNVFPRITSIYVMGPTEERGILRVFLDVTPDDQDASLPGRLYDASGLPVMQRGLLEPAVEEEPWADEFGVTMSGYAPITRSDGRPLGLVGLDVDAESVASVESRVLRTTLVLLGLVGIFLLIIGVQVGRSLRYPLSRVMYAATEVAGGNFRARVGLERRDEFGRLGQTFDHMAHGLEERELLRETFGRYVSHEIAEELLAAGGIELGGEERDVTVMLTDLAGYSTISEGAAPSQVVALLNEYLGAMNAVVDDHLGCVLEYTGDGILAVFGAPNRLPDHAEQAVRCAMVMRDELERLNERWEAGGQAGMWRARGIERLEARVGLHKGRVVAGNLGGETRLKYSVIGETVNVAARLEQLNKALGSEILMSDDVHEALPDALAEQAVDQGSHLVKGRSEAIHTWSI